MTLDYLIGLHVKCKTDKYTSGEMQNRILEVMAKQALADQ